MTGLAHTTHGPSSDRLARILLLAGLTLLCAASARQVDLVAVHAQSAGPSDDSKSPAVLPPAHYDLRFGPNPYLPSLARTDFSGFLKPEEIPSAAYCSRCHADVHSQWRQSAHANSFRTPWYVKNVQALADQKGVAYTRHCEGCHNPAALVTGALTPASTVPRPHDNDGVTCMVCHSISAVSSNAGIGSYILSRPAVLVDDAGKPVPGLPADDQILTHLAWHKRAVMRPLYQTSEYCGSCHKAALPKQLNDYKWLRTFSTYDEWQQSSWSTETPLSFYAKQAPSGCQTCHMQSEAARDPAAHAGQVASHRWLGANSAVPTQYGYAEQERRLIAFLKDDQIEVDIFGLTVEPPPAAKPLPSTPSGLIAPLGSRAFTVLPGQWVRVDVVVRNKGIGHTLIPELRDFYESWLEFSATDQRGQTVFHSGAIGPDHKVDANARSYGLKIIAHDGEAITHHDVWRTYTKAFDATISPGKSDVVRYRFQLPLGAQAVTLHAAVRYRRFNRAFTDWVFDDKPSAPDRFPTITLAENSLQLAAGLNQPTHPQPVQAELLRWNNYGIGMLDRAQFAEAIDAFTHVNRLDPAYEPGLVNLAIARYSEGSYAQSLNWLDRALAMKPDDSRALYFKGLNLRWLQRFDEAITTLEPVGRRWPRFRQVHQELGYLYMTVRRFPAAKAEYEQVLAVDPDDPSTHRWLAPVLEAMGDHAGAVREGALSTQRNNDTAALWTAQHFWRDHLDIAANAIPSHVFSDGNRADDYDLRRVLNLMNPPSYIWVEHY